MSLSQRLICILIGIAVVACAPSGGKKKGTDSTVKTCVLPPEQANSLQGHWGSVPVKVSFKSGDWNNAQMAEIQAGGEVWNNHFSKVRNTTVFNLTAGNLSTAIQANPSCNAPTLADGVVIYGRQSGWTKSPTAIAVTSTCFTLNTGALPTFTNAIMEFNFVNFFVDSSGKFPDLKSIAIHELGHLLGLDHTCGPLNAPNQQLPNVACPDPNANINDPLIATVMFPQVFFDSSGNGEVKHNLTENDQGRANCLY